MISTSKLPPGSVILQFTVTAGVLGSKAGWKYSSFDGESFGSVSPFLPTFGEYGDQSWGLYSTDTALELLVGTDGGAGRHSFEFIVLNDTVYMEAAAAYTSVDQFKRKWSWTIPSRVIAGAQVINIVMYN